MDELPDLQTDADVDALMGRLRARLSPPPAPAAAARRDTAAPPPSDAGVLAELAATQEGLATAVMRAMTAIADALDDLHAAGDEPAAAPAVPARVRRPATAAAATRRPGARVRRRG